MNENSKLLVFVKCFYVTVGLTSEIYGSRALTIWYENIHGTYMSKSQEGPAK
jgi:hypothetical protein